MHKFKKTTIFYKRAPKKLFYFSIFLGFKKNFDSIRKR
ncbi:hypothetical protein FCR2A7T_12640 [Flavobacterium cauense R2A-7]|nr:hypothetical protein FCR2A7T_12640 [Flavobacterium cauense R2A-7]